MNIEQKLDSTFFNVTKIKEQQLDKETQELKDIFYLVNRETGNKITQVSDRYTIVHNRDLVMPIVSKFGIDALEDIKNYGNSFFYCINTGRQFEIQTGDIVNEQIKIINSYNKTRSFRFMIGAKRLVCQNGLIAFRADMVNYKKIHVGVIPTKELTELVLNNYMSNTFELWHKMAQKPLTRADELELINSFCAFEAKKEATVKYGITFKTETQKLNEQIKGNAVFKLGLPDTPNQLINAWQLFNDLNWSIDRATNDINKKITANQRLENYLVNELSLA